MNLYHSLQNLTNWNDFESSQRNFNKKQQGTRFELLTKELFTWHPLYRGWIQNAWLSTELPIWVQKTLNLKSDIGFDLILEDNEGSLIPVQCKYHSDPNRNVGWKEASTFVGLYNDKKDCQEAFLCSNAFGVSKNFDSLQGKPINRILGSQWLQLDESFFSSIGNNDTKKLDPYIPLKHQEKAIRDAKSYFLKGGKTRGKLIFPCGSGKSLTGFWFTQHLGTQTTLIAVPSLALVKQTLEVYFREITAQNLQVKWLCVCSDHDIGAGVSEVKFSTHDIGIPSTTDSVKIKHWLKRTQGDNRYVFTTYQSGQRLADICKETGTQFDLGIFDEAHKTVGAKDKLFSHLLFHQNIKIERRIFMTATERFYTGSKDDIASMDNEEIYGEVFSKMSFKDAIATKLLTDYKIITIDVAKEEIASFIRKNKLVELNPKYGKEAEARSLASMFALRKAMQKLPIKNAVSFHSSIDKARRAESIQELLSKEFGFEEIDTFTVNGKDSVGKREKIINEFASSDNALITNARCLTEGVDVPKIDCIVFSDPKRSKVDIVQALGRALRKKEGKEWGYVILPVVYDNKTHEIDNDSFKDILGIVRGLAANDERIIEYFQEREKDQDYMSGKDNLLNFSSALSERLDQNALKVLGIKIWQGLSKFNWMPFESARQWAIDQNIQNSGHWRVINNEGGIPYNIPKAPSQVYEEWKSWGHFLGTGYVAPQLRNYLPFEEARKLVRDLKLTNQQDWIDYCKSDLKDIRIPQDPRNVYRTEWNGFGDWLGTGRIANQKKVFLAYEDAKCLLRDCGVQSRKEYIQLRKDRKDLPSNPDKVYHDSGWTGWADFLGKQKLILTVSYEEARIMLKRHNLKSRKDYLRFISSEDNIHLGLPKYPNKRYLNKGWNGWPEFLNSNANRKKDFWSFQKARQYVRQLNLKSWSEWNEFRKSDERPWQLPTNPQRYEEFIDMQDWLGIKSEGYLDFSSARKLAQSLKLKTWSSYRSLAKKGLLPKGLPRYPEKYYKNDGFRGMGDFLGNPNYSKKENNPLPFDEARKYARGLELNSMKEWKKIASENKLPRGIPKHPQSVYTEYTDYKDWLGIDKD